jgi:hypothetical protein
VNLLPGALEVRVVKRENSAKVKVKTKDGLFTFKSKPEEVDQMVKGLKVDVVEF